MNEFIGELTLDLDCRKTMPIITAGQFDKGRKYLVHITANDKTFSAAGSTAILQGIRRDKSLFNANCTVEEGNVILKLTDEILSVSGYAYAKLVLSDSNKNYSTQVFIIDVDGSYEGNITPQENYSLVNDFLNKIMLLFEMDSPADLLKQYPTTQNCQLNGSSPYMNADEAIENDIIYRCYYGGSGSSPLGWLVFCGSKKYVNEAVAQFRFHKSGKIYCRTGTANSGTVTWTETWIPFVPSSRKIANIDLQDDITAEELSAALGTGTLIITPETVPESADWGDEIPDTFESEEGKFALYNSALYYLPSVVEYEQSRTFYYWTRIATADELSDILSLINDKMSLAPINPTADQIAALPNGQAYLDTANHTINVKTGDGQSKASYDTEYVDEALSAKQDKFNEEYPVGKDAPYTAGDRFFCGDRIYEFVRNQLYQGIGNMALYKRLGGNIVTGGSEPPSTQNNSTVNTYEIGDIYLKITNTAANRTKVSKIYRCIGFEYQSGYYAYTWQEIPIESYSKSEIDAMIGNVESLLAEV